MLSIISLSVFGIFNLFLGFGKSKKILLPVSLVCVLAACVLNASDWGKHYLYFNDMLRVNNQSIAFSAIILLTVVLVIGISQNFHSETDEYAHPAEYYSMIFFATTGSIMMTTAEHLLMLFIGVEVLSVSLYVLTGSDKRNLRSNEAALKYFLMGAFATGIMLFGIALLYGATGSFNITGLGAFVQASGKNIPPIFYMGMLLTMIGLLFKVSVAPFHFWTPDVYDGSPTIFTTFMATVVKTAGFAIIYRLLSVSFIGIYSFWWNTIAILCMLTLIMGNITAVYQHSFKRTMAYSSISHAGYLLLAVLALADGSKQTILFYSLVYSLATISSFGVLMIVAQNKTTNGKPDESFMALNGLAKNNPLLAFVLTVSMCSLAGIPLTGGFWGKFFVFSNIVERGLTPLLVLAVLMSAVGIYYYFRAIIAVYMKEGVSPKFAIPLLYKLVLVFTTIASLVLGIFPDIVRSIF